LALHRFRIFTLDQANALLPTITALTERTREQLEQLQGAGEGPGEPAQERANDDARELIERWAHSVLALGAQPKGVFTVDFRTPDPNVLWCWAPDEAEICHRHFTWESFNDRISLTSGGDAWPGRN
jgi:hypothetical protein